MSISKLIAFMAMGLASSAFAGWTNVESALTAAKTEAKPILVNFTTRNVDGRAEKYNSKFRSDEFNNYAEGRLLLANAVLTGPKGWVKQNEAAVKADQAIALKYGVSFVPAVLVLNAAGQKIGQLTSADCTIDEFLKRLDSLTRLGLVPFVPKAQRTPTPVPTRAAP